MADEIKTTLSADKKKIIIEVPISEQPKETNKMMLVGSSGGFKDAGAQYKGKELRLNVMIGYRK